jgi:hypothetical protein
MEIAASTDATTAIAAMVLVDMDTEAAALAVTGITDAAMDIVGAATADGDTIAAAGPIRGTDLAPGLDSATIPTCTDIRATLRIRITRRIHTAGMDTRIHLIHRRNITNIPIRHRLLRGIFSLRRQIAI